jgi:hypothetical protein
MRCQPSIPKVSKDFQFVRINQIGNTVKRILIAVRVDDLVQPRQCPVVHTGVHAVRLCRQLNFHKAVLYQYSHEVFKVKPVDGHSEKPIGQVVVNASTEQLMLNVLMIEVSHLR